MYVYIESEHNPEGSLYIVGFYDPSGKWVPESDYDDTVSAAERCNFLNGEGKTSVYGTQLDEIKPIVPGGSVRVMRSYDYCHFEICLGIDGNATLDQVNERRKEAALLVDEAVRQYKIAKEKESRRERALWDIDRFLANIESIKEKPESEWSIEDAAMMRQFEDGEFWKQYHEDDYFYGDDEEVHRDHHFSMLHRFKETRISTASSGMKSS